MLCYYSVWNLAILQVLRELVVILEPLEHQEIWDDLVMMVQTVWMVIRELMVYLVRRDPRDSPEAWGCLDLLVQLESLETEVPL